MGRDRKPGRENREKTNEVLQTEVIALQSCAQSTEEPTVGSVGWPSKVMLSVGKRQEVRESFVGRKVSEAACAKKCNPLYHK